jgi:hippurate hydrolase
MKPEELLREAAEMKDVLIKTRRTLHAQPETGFELHQTLPFVEAALRELGLSPKRCGKCGLTATVGGKRAGKVFLLRADMDALPISEEAEVPFAAQNGCMHACGHDLHTAMLLGAARLLKSHEDEIEGTVKLMFQSAEEIFEGSRDMLQNGLLDAPKVDGAMMIHVMANMPMEPGTVVVSAPGISAPAADIFEITVEGQGCHGSMPNTGVDPLNAAAHILIALQEIHARELAMSDRAALTVGSIHGGAAANAIPSTVTMGGSIRAFDEEVRAFLKERLEQIATGTAAVFRARASVRFLSGCPTLRNDADLSRCAEDYTRELLGEKGVLSAAALASASGQGNKSAGSEDFAYVSQAVPSIMLALAAGRPEAGYAYPQHHPKVKFDEAALPVGAAVYAYMALRWLQEHHK